jgi:LacI family transcriptional regulator
VVSYKDIQRETGLALSTISKYFNGHNVTEQNRKAIETASATLNFRPNGFARNLRRRRSGAIGMLLPALDNEFHMSIVAGVETVLRTMGMSVIVASSPSAEVDAVEVLLTHMVDGIIAVPSHHDIAPLKDAARDLPVVTIDWDPEDLAVDGVVLDNVDAGAIAARNLIDHGHRDLALVGGDPSVSTMRLRALGFVEESRRRGISIPDERLTATPLTIGDARVAVGRLLALHPRPTAVFCANDRLTLGTLIAINESGLRLGRDISMIGFDSTDLAQSTVPRLTVIGQPMHEIARQAAAFISARLTDTGDREPETHVVAPVLLPGGSVARVDE